MENNKTIIQKLLAIQYKKNNSQQKPPLVQPIVVKPPHLKKALLIGINYYEDPKNKLNGCINDINNMKQHLLKKYPSLLASNIIILTDAPNENILRKPTRTNIIGAINWLVQGLKPGENVYFHYSGHGGLVVDKNGDEQTGKDSCIYPINKGKIEVIIDDELRSILANKIPRGCKCFAVLDCCHSGTALDLRNKYDFNLDNTILCKTDSKYQNTSGSVIFLSGCMDQQTSADTVDNKGVPSGALTNALLYVWNNYGSNIQWMYLLWEIRAFLKRGKYEQIPQLSSGIELDINSKFNLN